MRIDINHYNDNDDIIDVYITDVDRGRRTLLVSLNHDDDGRWGMERHLGSIREMAAAFNIGIYEQYVDFRS